MKLSGALDKDEQTPDFLEATIYSRENAVIMVGNFADVDAPKKARLLNFFVYHDCRFLDKQSCCMV